MCGEFILGRPAGRLAALIFMGLALATGPAFALNITDVTSDELIQVTGKFSNELRFVLKQPRDGAGTLSILKDGKVQDGSVLRLAPQTFRRSADARPITAPLVIPASSSKDRVVFFTAKKSLPYLTQDGKLGTLPLALPIEQVRHISVLADRPDFAHVKVDHLNRPPQLFFIELATGTAYEALANPLPMGMQIKDYTWKRVAQANGADDVKLASTAGTAVIVLSEPSAKASAEPPAEPPILRRGALELTALTEDVLLSASPAPILLTEDRPDLPPNLLKFKNGSWLERNDDATRTRLLYHADASTQPVELAEAEEILLRDEEQRKAGELAVVQVDDRIRLVFQTGRTAELPINASEIFQTNGEPHASHVQIQHEGRNYWVLSFKFAQGKGETYVVRDDGTSVRLDHDARFLVTEGNAADEGTQPSALVKVKNGFLSVQGSRRQIDLTLFEAEARQNAGKPETVKSGDGGEIIDVVEFVDKQIPEMLEKIRRGEVRPFNMSSQHMTTIMEDVEEALISEETASVAITAPSGAGKSQFAYAFFKSISEGKFRTIPRTVKIYKIDALQLSQGTKYVGVFEAKLKAIVEAAKTRPTLLFIDEMQNLVQAGAHADNPIGFFSLLLEAMANGNIRIVGTCTDYDFFHYFLGNPVLKRRFQEARLKEPNKEETLEAMKEWIRSRKGPERIAADAVLERAYELTTRLNPEGAQPAKATKLLDKVYARVEAGRGHSRNGIPTLADIDEGAMRLHKADRALLDPDTMREKLRGLRGALDKTHAGLADLKDALQELTELSYFGSSGPLRAGFVGIKGTGKTSIYKSWAKAMALPEVQVLAMGAYAQGDVKAFFRQLAQALEVNAFTPILLDELDAAHPDVQIALQTALEEGYFYIESVTNSASGATTFRRISLKNTPVAFTTNLGTDYILKEISGKGKGAMTFSRPQASDLPNARTVAAGLKNAVATERSTSGTFIRPELLERFPHLLPFLPSDREQFAAALRIHLMHGREEQSRIQRAPVTVQREDEFVAYATQHFFRDKDSLRVAKQAVDVFLTHGVKEARKSGRSPEGTPLEITFDAESFQLTTDRLTGCLSLLRRSKETTEPRTAH